MFIEITLHPTSGRDRRPIIDELAPDRRMWGRPFASHPRRLQRFPHAVNARHLRTVEQSSRTYTSTPGKRNPLKGSRGRGPNADEGTYRIVGMPYQRAALQQRAGEESK